MHVSHAAITLERALLNEWNDTLATTRHTYGTLGDLTGDEAVNLIRQPQTAEARDLILLELLELEHAGHVAAGKVVVKSFLALAFRLARTSSSVREIWRHSPTDATATTIGALWEVVHTYPLHRSTSAAGNIRLECIKLLEKGFGTIAEVDTVTVDDATLEYLVDSSTEPVEDTFRDLVTLLTWAIDNDVLTRDEVRLLTRIELAEGNPGKERALAAEELGISRETLNRRVHRIRTKLMTAVCGDVAERTPYAPRRR